MDLAEKVSSGDLVRLEYTGRVGEKAFDTTDADAAKQAGIFNEKSKYGPVLVAAGKEQVIKGLDEALVGSEVGVEKKITVPSDKGFGERRPELVRLISLGEFRKRGVDPVPGMVLDLDDARAIVQSVSGGRVKVDLNHELAGKTLEYSFKVVERVTEAKDKVAALAKELLPALPAPVFSEGKATIVAPAEAAKDSDYIVSKIRFVQQALALVPEVKAVVVVEEYSKPAARKEEGAKAEAGAKTDAGARPGTGSKTGEAAGGTSK
ncbi:MAG: peptidylprolyl isomerase [Candidatus Micrarchaeota archaeon]|nr:peptidylprolyl isomerase [Candidatus Micrarchaeota archaeon]